MSRAAIYFTDADAWERSRDHAWRYFEIHAGQRMSMFNFFIVLAGFALAGIGATLQASQALSVIGIALGILLSLLSFVFWKLDQRAAFLVKHSETALKEIEEKLLPAAAHIFRDEPTALEIACLEQRPMRRVWTFGRSLRFAFGVMGFIGIAATLLSGLRVAGIVSLEKPEHRPKMQTTSQLQPLAVPSKTTAPTKSDVAVGPSNASLKSAPRPVSAAAGE